MLNEAWEAREMGEAQSLGETGGGCGGPEYHAGESEGKRNLWKQGTGERSGGSVERESAGGS